jgi:hypothetical protein
MRYSSGDLEIHTILYIKGWYVHTDDIIKDLAIICEEYFGVGREYVNDEYIWHLVNNVYDKYVKHKKDLRDIISMTFKDRMFLKLYEPNRASITYTDIIQILFTEIRHNVMSKDVVWVRPDSSLMPLNKWENETTDEHVLNRRDELHKKD